MNNKNGFTLVELLAVIVILGFLTSVVSLSVINSKKKANVEEAKKLEKEIESFGADLYMDKRASGKYGMSELEPYGLVLQREEKVDESEDKGKALGIKNPSGKGYCYAYLEITSYIEFKGYIDCGSLYKTAGYDDTGINDDIRNPNFEDPESED